MNSQNPNTNGNPTQVAAQIAKAVKEALAAQQKESSAVIDRMLASAEQRLQRAASDAIAKEEERLKEKYIRAGKRAEEVAEKEKDLALLEAQLEGRIRLNERTAKEIEDGRVKITLEREQLEIQRADAERFMALRAVAEAQIEEHHRRELAIAAELEASQSNYKAEREALAAEKAAQDAALAAALSHYAPELAERLQAYADEFANDEHEIEELPESATRRKAPKKKPKTEIQGKRNLEQEDGLPEIED